VTATIVPLAPMKLMSAISSAKPNRRQSMVKLEKVSDERSMLDFWTGVGGEASVTRRRYREMR
jgi:hypothetical protein